MTDVPAEDGEAMGNPPLRDATALCLSGGGYRAMVFHLGVLWRLYDSGKLRGIERVSSVSGGSITAAVLGLAWRRLSFDPGALREDFVREVVAPVRALADKTIDLPAVFLGLALPGTIGDRIARAYDRHLFHGATLQDLPDSPRFVINATNLQSAALWRFSKPYMRDYRVGEVKAPTLRISHAVAASSAFPPMLSPVVLDLDPATFTSGSGIDLQREPFTRRVFLTDGGVYDNLGLQTAESFRTVLVSDGGGKTAPEERPRTDWARHSYRVLDVVDNQVRSLRKAHLVDAFERGARSGAYWGIRTDLSDYRAEGALPCPHERTLRLANLPTRLGRMPKEIQERLVNWGYAVCDAALRAHVYDDIPPPKAFPYACGI